MPEISQYLCFFDGLLPLLLAHMVNTHLFYNKLLASVLLLDKIGLSESTLPEQFLFLVELIFSLYDSHFHSFQKIININQLKQHKWLSTETF